MKKRIFSIAIIALAFVSCQKEILEPEPKPTPTPEKVTFNASIENAVTKTTIDEGKVSWEEGDCISINGVKFVTTQAGTSSPFNKDEKEKNDVEGDVFHAFFPYGIQTKDNEGNLPSTQSFCGVGKIGNLPMYATSADYKLTFHNICSVFAVKITSADIDIVQSITISSEDKAMCGAFSVDSKSYTAVLSEPGNVKNTVTLDCGKGVDPGKDGTIFYIAIPAQTYTNIRVEVSNGEITKPMTTKVKQITTEVNTIYPMNFLLEGSSVLLEAPFIDEIL